MRISVRFYSALTLLVGASLPGQQPLRPAGADVVVIVPDSLPDVPRTLTELLAARAPGVTVQRATGSIGGGSWVSLRDGGAVRGADPLVVVDGVRRARRVLDAVELFSPSAIVNITDYERRPPSPLDDIPVEDVERIEILRGPAAANAYGADGRYGVIVVTTRTPGRAPKVAASLGGGVASGPLDFARGNVRVASNGDPCPWGYEGTMCSAVGTSRYTPLLDHPFVTSGAQRSARIAVDRRLGPLAGSVALSHEKVEGVIPADGRDRSSATARLGVPLGTVTLGYAGQWSARGIALPVEDGESLNPWFAGAAYRPRDCSISTPCGTDSSSRGYYRDIGDMLSSGARNRRTHHSHAVTMGVRLGDVVALSTRLSGDFLVQKVRWADPAASRATTYESERHRRMRARLLGVEQEARFDFGTAERHLTSRVALRYDRATGKMRARQAVWATDNGSFSIQEKWAGQDYDRLESSLQQRLTFGRLDAGAGLTVLRLRDWDRGGDEPTLGEPAADAAYALLRREGLYVRARVAAARTRSFEDLFLGYSNRLPDRVGEVEGGLDVVARLVRGSATFYRRTERSEGILPAFIPSAGFPPPTPVSRAARGLELALGGDVLRHQVARLRLDGTFAVENDEVNTGPDVEMLSVSMFGQLSASHGQSYGSWRAARAEWTDANGDGRVTPSELAWGEISYAGRSRPSRLASLTSGLTLFDRVTLGAHLDYRGGYLVPDAARIARCFNWVCPAIHDPGASIQEQIDAWAGAPGRGSLVDGDAVRVRELSLSYDDASLARTLGASRLRMTIAVKNAGFLWTRSNVWDPETFSAAAVGATCEPLAGLQAPIPREVVLRASLSY